MSPIKYCSITDFISDMLGLLSDSDITFPSLSHVSVSLPQFIKNEYDFWSHVINGIVLVASLMPREVLLMPKDLKFHNGLFFLY